MLRPRQRHHITDLRPGYVPCPDSFGWLGDAGRGLCTARRELPQIHGGCRYSLLFRPLVYQNLISFALQAPLHERTRAAAYVVARIWIHRRNLSRMHWHDTVSVSGLFVSAAGCM